MARRHRILRTIEGRKRYERRAKTLVTASVLIALLAFPYIIYRGTFTASLSSVRSFEEAQIARNIARGEGFVTNYIRPSMFRARRSFTKSPDLANPPLYIWILGQMPGMGKSSVETPPDATVIRVSSFFYFVSAIALYFIGRGTCGIRTGFIAALIYILYVPLLRAATSGSSLTLSAFLVTILFFLAYLDPNRSLVLSFTVGLLIGLCYLSEYGLLVLLVPFAFHSARIASSARFRHVIVICAGVAIVAGSWMLRNLACDGSPLAGQPLSSLFLASAASAGGTSLGLWGKFCLQVMNFYDSMLAVFSECSLIALAFFLISPLTRYGNEELQKAKSILWSCILLFALVSVFGSGDAERMLVFAPVAILLGTKSFMDLVARLWEQKEHIAARMQFAFVLLSILPFIFAIAGGGQRGRWLRMKSRQHIKDVADMRELVHPGALVMTNSPEWLAYYGGFHTMPLPKSRRELLSWEAQFGRLGFAAILPYGKKGRLTGMILEQKKAPVWFISHEAYQYPGGEHFFVGGEAGT